MSFELPSLPYDYDALEPYIDSNTMNIHHTKHHAGYTNKLNTAVESEGLSGQSIEDILANVSKYSTAVRNNGGGFYNHSLFWSIMTPNGKGKAEGDLYSAIENDFGSWDSFKEQFEKAAATRFGSGWAWLLWDGSKLVITSTPNQDNPLMDIAEVKGTPILGLDVWEHAYYLKYQNKRPDYISAWWNVVNWDQVNTLWEKAKEGVAAL